MNRTLTYLLAFAGIAAVAALGTVYAYRVSEDEAMSIASAKIGLAQAVTIAESHVRGKAVRAEYEDRQGQWVFEVEVARGVGVMDVTIDAATGAVLASVGNMPDAEAQQDKD